MGKSVISIKAYNELAGEYDSSLLSINLLKEQATRVIASLDAKQSEIEQLEKTGVALFDKLTAAEAALLDKSQQYEFRHNQALAANDKVRQLSADLADAKYQYESFRRDVTALLFFQQFPGGARNDIILTRVRNRLIGELSPITERCPVAVCNDQTIEQAPSIEVLEQTRV